MVVLTVTITLFCIFLFIFCCCCQETNFNVFRGVAHKSAKRNHGKKNIDDTVSIKTKENKSDVSENNSNSFSVSITSGSKELYGMCLYFWYEKNTNCSYIFILVPGSEYEKSSKEKFSTIDSVSSNIQGNDIPKTSVRSQKEKRANSFKERLIEEIQSPPYIPRAAYKYSPEPLNNKGSKNYIPASLKDQSDHKITSKNNSKWKFAEFIWSWTTCIL